MTLCGLVLLLILTSCDSNPTDCDDCNHNGRWWPLFKPSQIIHSEFPEHAQRRSQEAQYGHGLFQHNSVEQPPLVVSQGSREAAGFDSEVKTYNSQGKHRLEWDHYGDVSHVTTVAYNSLEVKRGDVSLSANSEEVPRPSAEDHSLTAPEEGILQEGKEVEDKESSESREVSFFNDENFFKGKSPSVKKGGFLDDFDISQESSSSSKESSPENLFSQETLSKEVSSKEIPPTEHSLNTTSLKKVTNINENHKSRNYIDMSKSHEIVSRYKKPMVATSYSAFSSIFSGSKPVDVHSRDLLHPDPSFNEVSNYIQSPRNSPVSRIQYFDGRNLTNQYLVHENQPDVLRINPLAPAGRSNQRRSPFPPKNHRGIHRYVKSHGGLLHHYRHQPRPLSRSSSLRWQDVRPELRNKFPFKQLQPLIRVQSHETRVRHVLPTMDTPDSLWKETKRMESLKPPPFGQNLYVLTKKPTTMDLKKVERNQGNSFVYIIKTNKRIT